MHTTYIRMCTYVAKVQAVSFVFSCSQCPFPHWWWVPLIAPMIGAVIAAPLYWFVVEGNHPEGSEDEVSTLQGRRTFTPQEDFET